MGFSVKFNWVLQATPPALLEINAAYVFRKKGNRIFPLDTPIDLIDMERNAIAKIKIINFQNTLENTQGEYEIIKVYSGDEKRILTNYWIENQ
ncbi:hypothetical protein MED121_17149 [Marinomonas sp. MED121]|uniref:DUF2584 family protein n=1 Tax=Marinomonas sp. MED121 TaxID=314277 RepID=UPI00006910FD|nr:DUF2584 family protein [Marinomonas sp. MED121]EAQ67675.1 hypothetical protein MED121_17149 [Marinomonas sp. MED121]